MNHHSQRQSEFPIWTYAPIVPLLWTWGTLSLLDFAFIKSIGYSITWRNLIITPSLILFLCLPLVLIPIRMRKVWAIFCVLFFSFIVFADILHMRYFETIVSIWEIPQIRQLPFIMDGIIYLISPKDKWLLVILFIILIFAIVYRLPKKTQDLRHYLSRYNFICLLLICSMSLPSIYVLKKDLHYLYLDKYAIYNRALSSRGLVYSHLLNILHIMRENALRAKLSTKDKQKVINFFIKHKLKIPSTGIMYGCVQGKNVIFIQVESLQSWLINKQIYGQQITPFLNKLSKKYLYYPNIFDQTRNGRSSDGEFVILNSLFSLEYGKIASRCTFNHFIALPLVLKQARYTTLASNAYLAYLWNIKILHSQFKFERTMYQKELGNGVYGEFFKGILSDRDFLKRMILELDSLPKPFFASLATISSHFPFIDIPEKYYSLNIGELKGTLLGRYIHSIHYVDNCLKQFFNDLEKTGLLKETVIFIYGDHDAGIPFDSTLLQFLGYEKQNPALSEVSIDRIPLFVISPDIKLKGEISAIGGQADIAPTLLYLLGIEQPASFIGEPLPPFGTSNIVPLVKPWGSAVTQDLIFLRDSNDSSKRSCFKFSSGEPLPINICEDLAKCALEKLEMSQQISLLDLAGEISNFNN